MGSHGPVIQYLSELGIGLEKKNVRDRYYTKVHIHDQKLHTHLRPLLIYMSVLQIVYKNDNLVNFPTNSWLFRGVISSECARNKISLKSYNLIKYWYVVQWKKPILICGSYRNYCENRFGDSRRICIPALSLYSLYHSISHYHYYLISFIPRHVRGPCRACVLQKPCLSLAPSSEVVLWYT